MSRKHSPPESDMSMVIGLFLGSVVAIVVLAGLIAWVLP